MHRAMASIAICRSIFPSPFPPPPVNTLGNDRRRRGRRRPGGTFAFVVIGATIAIIAA